MSARAFAFGMAGVAVVVVALAVLALESPAVARARRIDERRTGDLQRIAAAIDAHWAREKSLPPDLEALARGPERWRFEKLPTDPLNQSSYGYRVTGERSYELCATFSTESLSSRYPGFWIHPAGEHCFPLDAERKK